VTEEKDEAGAEEKD
jgi:hypothetical protein